MLSTLNMISSGEWGSAVGLLGLTLGIGLGAAALGFCFGQSVSNRRI